MTGGTTGPPWRVLSLPPLDQELMRHLFADLASAEMVFPATRDRAGLHAALSDADLVIGDYTGELAMDAAAVAAAPRLAFVQMPQVGVDSCDLPALTAAGVPVANTAGANARSVAEWALGAAFALCRRYAWADRRMREGRWPQSELIGLGTREVHTRRVGILGFGEIGAQAARLFGALGCRVSYWSRRERPGTETEATYLEVDELMASSDILVIALPLTPETAGMIDRKRLDALPRGAMLINVARGGIVLDQDIHDALESGRLAGAALDVFETEPLDESHPLRSHENVLLSPHAAGATDQAQFNIITRVKENIAAAVAGQEVSHVVNGLDAVIHRRAPHGA